MTQPVTDAELCELLSERAMRERSEPVNKLLWAAYRALLAPDDGDRYRIALRPDDQGHLDDVVVKDVSTFRMEDMGDWWWICCYLAGTDERICWSARGTTKRSVVRMSTIEQPTSPDIIYEARG